MTLVDDVEEQVRGIRVILRQQTSPNGGGG
jgi:hypothetical protein